jgi:hypothetical protein
LQPSQAFVEQTAPPLLLNEAVQRGDKEELKPVNLLPLLNTQKPDLKGWWPGSLCEDLAEPYFRLRVTIEKYMKNSID